MIERSLENLIVDMYRDNRPVRAIAAVAQVSTSTVNRVIKRRIPLEVREVKGIGLEREKDVCSMYQTSSTIEEIISQTGVHKETIYRTLEKYGIPLRNRK